jgi:hypothetical protein
MFDKCSLPGVIGRCPNITTNAPVDWLTVDYPNNCGTLAPAH